MAQSDCTIILLLLRLEHSNKMSSQPLAYHANDGSHVFPRQQQPQPSFSFTNHVCDFVPVAVESEHPGDGYTFARRYEEHAPTGRPIVVIYLEHVHSTLGLKRICEPCFSIAFASFCSGEKNLFNLQMLHIGEPKLIKKRCTKCQQGGSAMLLQNGLSDNLIVDKLEERVAQSPGLWFESHQGKIFPWYKY